MALQKSRVKSDYHPERQYNYKWFLPIFFRF